jgi:hypothetical protein
MTVAIAALCGLPNDIAIIAAADHMITAGDIEFEQPQPKIWRLSEHCVALFFGLSAAQGEIANQTEVYVQTNGITDVGVIAGHYARFLRALILREAEADVMAPLGLTLSDLTKATPTVNQALPSDLKKQMQTYYRGSGLSDDLGGALVIGTDNTGAHIYRVEDGHVSFQDPIGFVAAGGGQWHAESQFMFARYTRWWPFPDALSLLYSAKKHAEVAPGVGEETDLVIVTTRPPNVIHAKADSDLVRELENIYQETKKKQDVEFAKQHVQVKAFIDKVLRTAPAPQATPVGEIGPAEVKVTTQPVQPEATPKPSRKKKA